MIKQLTILVDRLIKLPRVLTGEVILLDYDKNKLNVDVGSKNTSLVKKAATDFFHQTYTNLR